MNNTHPEIDRLIEETTVLMTKVLGEYGTLNIDSMKDNLAGTAYIGFRIGYDYFMAAKQSLIDEHLLSGTCLVRSGLENIGDLFYIYCTPKKKDQYAKAYVESTARYNGAMVMAKIKGLDVTARERLLKQANKWTGASIEERLQATGPSILTAYDMMSYFSHPNPAAVTYLEKPRLLKGQINLVKQSNCMTAINLIGLSISNANIKDVTRSELNKIAMELGFPLMQTP